MNKWIIGGAAALGAGYVLSLRGRRNHPGLSDLRGWKYAHRGLYGEGVPENSLAAFRAAVEHGYGAEFDVHLLADGGLGILHDSDMKRMTGADRKIESLTTPELTAYHLQGTDQVIPTFQQVLEIFAGKTPLIIELKTTRADPAPLCKAVCDVLDGYRGVYCLESFDPRCVRWLRMHRPDLIRGQLSYRYYQDPGSIWDPVTGFFLANTMENFWTRPDFVAYDYPTRKTLSNFLCRKLWGIQGVTWTIRTREDFDTAVKEGWIPIFERIRP